MREYSEKSASRCDLLEWILNIIDDRIKQENHLAQHYRATGEKS